MLQWAADDTATGSQAGSVGCHSTDNGSDTESLGQSLPSTAQESPSVGTYSSPLHTTPTPTIYYDLSAVSGMHTFGAIDSVYTSCVSMEHSGAFSDAGLSHIFPTPHSPWAPTW